MFSDLRRYSWVLEPVRYPNVADLMHLLRDRIIPQAEFGGAASDFDDPCCYFSVRDRTSWPKGVETAIAVYKSPSHQQ
jgi:hypothetical protein